MGVYIFTFAPRKRSKSNPRYEGILKTHRFYIEYYSLMEGEDPKNIKDKEPYIEFPASYIEDLVSFAEELGGSIVEKKKIPLPRTGHSYTKYVVQLPDDIAFRRHMLYAITASTFRKPEKLYTLRSLISTRNANLLNLLSQIAVDRYKELKENSISTWIWRILRVGKALKVLYMLDR